MASAISIVPQDPEIDLNTYLNKYAEDEHNVDNPLTASSIDSQYFDLEQLTSFLHNNDNEDTSYEYRSLHLNIQSLPAKFDALKLLIHEFHEKLIELDFIMLCETFLKDETTHHFDIPGYNLVYKNRPGASRGGVAIYVHKKFDFKMRDDLVINIPGTFESIFIEIQNAKFKAIVGEIYRIPNTNEIISIDRYETIIKQLQDYKNTIIIGTDQNFDYIKIDQHKNIEDLLNVFLTNGLVPTITKPTRITHTSATLIDNIYVSIKNKNKLKSAILCTDISDHLPVVTCILQNKRQNNSKQLTIKKRLFTKETTNIIANMIKNTDWNYLEQLNTNDAYIEFTNTISNIIDKAAPEKTFKIPAKYL